MKTEKCNILWIDDELEEGKAIYKTYERAKQEYADKLCIDIVRTVIDFQEKIKSEQKRYYAVIMDVNIIEDGCDDEPPCPMITRIKNMCKEQNGKYKFRLYAYSGSLNYGNKPRTVINDIKDQLGEGFTKNPHTSEFFWNKGDMDADIFEDILKDFNERDYAGFEYILDLYSNNHLKLSNKCRMDEFLNGYKQLQRNELIDNAYRIGDHIRYFLEDMIATFAAVQLIPKTVNKKRITLNQGIDYIAKKCRMNSDNTINYEDPFVPFEVCPSEIKYILLFLGDIASDFHHSTKEEGTKHILSDEIIHLILQSLYPAFFVVMKWFYEYMEKRKTI